MDFKCSDSGLWKEALSSYDARIEALNKPNLLSLDAFYRNELPLLLRQRNPTPYLITSDLTKLMQWKLTRGKWRHDNFLTFTHRSPRLLDFVSSLDDAVVKSASQAAFQSLPDVSKAVSELTVLKGVGPATASAVLAAYAPDVAPFMSDEAMQAALGNSKDYTLKQYLVFVDKLQAKAEVGHAAITLELTAMGVSFTPSDIERALWSCAMGVKLSGSSKKPEGELENKSKRKRKR
nr:Ena/VASP-like protein [Ipomoea batatas]